MDQIGKLYQNRAMVLQEEVTRLEQLLLELRISRQIAPGEELDFSRPTPEQRAANQVVGGGAGGGLLNPGGAGDDIMSRIGNAALDSPYWTTGIGLLAGYNLRKVPAFAAGLISPNRLMTRDFSPENGGLNSPYNKPTRNLQGELEFSKPQQPRSPINWFDKEAFRRAEEVLKQRGEQAQALAAAEEKTAKAAQLVKDQAAAAKSYDLTKDLASKSTLREPPEIIGYAAGKPVYGPGRLTPEGQVEVGKTQEGIHPYEKPGARASAEMQSGQMRRTAVADLSSEVRAPTRGGGNAAAIATDLPTMSGREVAGKLKGVAGKALNVGGKLMDPVGEAASTVLGTIARTLGLGTAVGSGVGMLPAVIGFFDSPAYAPTIPLTQKEQDEWDANIKSYEESERKRNEDNTALEKSATNPSGNFTPDPETQYERDWQDEVMGTRDTVGRAIDVESRRMAAKRGDRRSRWGEREQDFLQSRPQQ
jgi:hypothetical protein